MSLEFYATHTDTGASVGPAATLQDVLALVHEAWGGKAHKAEQIAPALSHGGGQALVAVEDGRAVVERRRSRARSRDAEEDGRERLYRAVVELGRHEAGAARFAPVRKETVVTRSLVEVFKAVASIVAEELGSLPDCLHYDAVHERLPKIRRQMHNAKASGRPFTIVNFPNTHDAPAFIVPSRSELERYAVFVALDVDEPTPPTSILRKFKQ